VARATRLVVAALVVLVGCGEDGPVTAAQSLRGRTFLSESVTESGVNRPLVAGTRIRLAFGDSGITVTAGCNTLGADVEITEDRLLVGELSSTEIGSDQPRDDQDSWLAGILAADPGYTLDGDHLTLTSGPTTIALLDRRVAEPDRPLEGTVWQLDGLIDGDTASSAPAGVRATLRIGVGQLTGEIDGCGRASTTVATVVAGAMTAALDGTVTYRIEASSLTVTNPNGRGLMFQAVE
jgi:heat shock protein HslJ